MELQWQTTKVGGFVVNTPMLINSVGLKKGDLLTRVKPKNNLDVNTDTEPKAKKHKA